VRAYGGTAAANVSGLTPALSRLRGTYALARSGGGVRYRSPRRSGPSRPSGRCRLRRPRPLRLEGPPLYAGRYALCGYGSIERGGLCGGRSAKPRGAAPELAVHYAHGGRATSHNGARYAFVHPARTRGSHVALSGAPPRCLQAEKSGSDCRHTFRPSGNPTGWNRKRSVPLALLSARSGVVGNANGAAKRYAALRRGKPHTRFPLCPRFKLPVSVPVYARPGHPQFQARPFTSFPDSRHESCGDNFRAGPEDALRAFTVAASLRQPARQETCHAGCWSLRPRTKDLRSSLFSRPGRKRGPRKQNFAVLGHGEEKSAAQDALQRAIRRRPLSRHGGKSAVKKKRLHDGPSACPRQR